MTDSVVAFDPTKEREKSRELLAKILISLLVAIVVASFCTMWFRIVPVDDLIKVLNIVFNPMITMAASVLGFYYGGKSG